MVLLDYSNISINARVLSHCLFNMFSHEMKAELEFFSYKFVIQKNADGLKFSRTLFRVLPLRIP
jgi:hypothetical protein